MRRKFNKFFDAIKFLVKSHRCTLSHVLLVVFSLGSWLAAGQPIISKYSVIPDESGQFITVQAELQLQNKTPYLKDFGQLESIRWHINDQEIPIKAERKNDLLVFKDLPAWGEARAVYKLKCVTHPTPGYRKRLMGSQNYILAREGLYLGFAGRENELINVEWMLPPGWQLALGNQGKQRFMDTQKMLWVAGKIKKAAEEKIGNNIFRVSVLEGTFEMGSQRSVEAIKAIFQHAWQIYGPLEEEKYGIAIFPRESIGGGTAFGYTIASEENWITAVHEILHWWTNPVSPAWFREGVHTYLSAKILAEFDLISREEFMQFLKGCLIEHGKVIEREGRLFTLDESSQNYDRQSGGGDMYGLMPLFAYRLDREIQENFPGSSLDQVFAAVCRERQKEFDLLALIKEVTGYDPLPLFQKYFYARVKNTEELIK